MNARIRLFLSSYVPLFVAGAVRFDHPYLQVTLVVAAVIGVASLISLIRVTRKNIEPDPATPTAVRDMGSEVAAYIATYLLPFITVDNPDKCDLVAYSIVFFTIAVVFINSDLVGVNPLLYLLRYRTYRVTGIRKLNSGADADAIVISRRVVVVGSPIRLAKLATGVSLVVK